MKPPRAPLFLERETYRRRRIMDGARILPVAGFAIDYVRKREAVIAHDTRLTRLLTMASSALRSGNSLRKSKYVDYRVDVTEATIRSRSPFPYQVDGDYLGEVTELRFRWEPDALRLVRPVLGS